jgi:hypothetical protein
MNSIPTAAEQSRFIAAADAATVTAADIDAMTSAPLRTALEMKKRAADRALNELDDQVEQLVAAASSGSAYAAVALYLASQIDSLGDYFSGYFQSKQSSGLSSDTFLSFLKTASDRGDALASFWYAMSLRATLFARTEAISRTDPQFISYCNLLEDAGDRGMEDIAWEQLDGDGCP